MNYNSVEEILSAGTTNMTVIRNNSKQDDGTDSITGVSWFTFNGKVASTIYANGNSWIGFGASSEQLKVNRRDGAMWYLYREEGTLYNHYNFLKIRWSGYSRYNQTSTKYKLEYDVILWDTGDISLHMISIPTSYNTGTYSLVESSTYNYTVSTSTPDVTFLKTDSGFTVNNSLITLDEPYDKRYLIRDGSKYYTVVDSSLSEITVTELNSTVFLTYGVEDLFDISLLSGLSNPEILFWRDSPDDIEQGLIIEGTPQLPQVVYYESQDISSYTGIEKAEVAVTGDVLFAISFDNKQTWKYYDYLNKTWLTATTDSDGMNAATIKNIPASAWSEVITSSTFVFRCSLLTLESSACGIYIKYV